MKWLTNCSRAGSVACLETFRQAHPEKTYSVGLPVSMGLVTVGELQQANIVGIYESHDPSRQALFDFLKQNLLVSVDCYSAIRVTLLLRNPLTGEPEPISSDECCL